MGLRITLSLTVWLSVFAVVVGTGWLGGGVTWTPREVEAAPPGVPTGFNVRSYSVITNGVTFYWRDDQDYPDNDACAGYAHAYQDVGWRVSANGTSGIVATAESAREGTTTALDWFGTTTYTLQYRYRVETTISGFVTGCRYGTSATAETTPRAQTAKVRVTSATYDRPAQTLTVNWVGGDYAFWKYGIGLKSRTSLSLTNAYTGDLASGTSTRTATITNLDLIAGSAYHLWIAGVASESTTINPNQSSRNYYSYRHEFEVPADPECIEGDVLSAGTLEGASHDVTGDFINSWCSLDPGTTSSLYNNLPLTEGFIYAFNIDSSRSVTITLNPATAFRDDSSELGQYRVRVRSASFDGSEIAVESGIGAFTLPALTIGSGNTYYAEVMRYGLGGGREFTLGFIYPFIERATPTPIPTQTPRPQPNVDFRLEPHPSQRDYAANRTYSFTFLGRESKFPVRVRVGNSAALGVGRSSSLTCSSTASDDDEVEIADLADTLYLRTCANSMGKNSTLTIMNTPNFELLAEYSIYVAPASLPVAPEAITPGKWGEERETQDGFGIGILVRVACQGFGIGCDDQLIKNGVWFVGAVFGACVPMLGLRGPASALGMALGVVVFILVLMVASLTSGFPPWLTGLSILSVFGIAGLGIYQKLSQVRT